MATDRRTKQQILEALALSEKRVAELDSLKSVVIQSSARVPEADALARCVRALDELSEARESSRSSSNYGMSLGPFYAPSSTERVLRTLAAKYRVDLFKTEIREQACSRRHVDDINPDHIMRALHADEPRPF